MLDNHYTNLRLARLYDVYAEPQPEEEEFFLSLVEKTPSHVLDLGCGVGKLCEAFAAQGHRVTGADPARAMLAVAADKPHAHAIRWVQSSAQVLNLETRFNLITMTGHAFQVFLTDEDILAALDVMHRHLAFGGRIAFESHNPAIDWAALWDRRPATTWAIEDDEASMSTDVLGWSGDLLTFEHRYTFPDEVLLSRSTLRFAARDEIEDFLSGVGFQVEHVFGDWCRNPFDATISPEMIFIARRGD